MEETLVYKAEVDLHGDSYQILVYSRGDGRHYAKTYFGTEDIIISDGSTLDETLERHQTLLPLAVDSRKILLQVPRHTRKLRSLRS